MRTSSLRTVGVAGIAFAGLVAAGLAATTSADAAGTTSVRVAEHVCTSPSSGRLSCDAMKLVTKQMSTSKAAQLEKKGAAKSVKASRLGSGPAGGYTPKQLARAYGINPNAKTRQKVAIVDAFDNPSVRKDLNAFDQRYGLHRETRKSFKVLNQQGHTSPLPSADEGWAGEITLDVQSVRAVCHHCRIILIEANNNGDGNLAKAVDQAVKQGAKIVSNSYGGPESPADPAWIRHAYHHKGVAVLASSGDDGWYDWDGANYYQYIPNSGSGNRSQVPASYSSVVGVGGTSLHLNPDGTRAAESVWNENGPADLAGAGIVLYTQGYEPGAAGSGCSKRYNAPAWQRHVKGYKSLGCGGKKRSEVDIAALADPFTGFDVYETFDWCTDPSCQLTSADNGWATYGGTSLSSPVIAGMWGLAGGAHGKHPAKTLYDRYKKSKGSTYDVRVGGTGGCYDQSPRSCSGLLQYSVYGPTYNAKANPNTGPAGLLDCAWGKTGGVKAHRGQCYAQPGYDGVSGVGTPQGLKVFKPVG